MQQKEDTHLSQAGTGLYERYASAIFAYLRLHVSSLEDAEDLLIEVFTIAFEHDNLSWLVEKQRFVWLRRVAQNKLVDRYRRSTRLSLLPIEQIIETAQIAEGWQPEQIILQRELLAQLSTTVKALPQAQQEVLQLRIGDDLPFADIAVLFDKREPTGRQLFSRAMAKLRKHYQP